MAFFLRAARTVKDVGGIRVAWQKILKVNDVRVGTLVGTDKFGNKYFENKTHFFGRDRWVDLIRKDFDPSQVPPEWHRWLHHTGDYTPVTHPPVERKFHLEHTENFTATEQEYVPYSTTRPKIESWKPPKVTR